LGGTLSLGILEKINYGAIKNKEKSKFLRGKRFKLFK
jgi:hypothetical protein